MFKGSAAALTARFLGIPVLYGFSWWVSRKLGAEAWGTFTICISLLSFFTVFSMLGLNLTLVRLGAQYKRAHQYGRVKDLYMKALETALPLGLVWSVLMFFGAGLFAGSVFHKPWLAEYFRIASFALLPIVWLTVNLESLRGQKAINAYAFYLNLSVYLITFALTFTLHRQFENHTITVIAFVVGNLLSALLTFVTLNYKISLTRIPCEFSVDRRTLLGISIPLAIVALMRIIITHTDNLLLGAWMSEADVGHYNIAFKISILTATVIISVNTIAAPKFAEFFPDKNMDGLRRVVGQASRMIFWLTVPMVVVLYASGSFILGIFGPGFEEAQTALYVLLAGQSVNAVCGSAGIFLVMGGHQKVFRNYMVIGAVLNVLINVALIPILGLTGAAIASAVGISSWNLLSVVYIYRKYRISTMYLPGVIGA